ncbi:bifunctional phosphopantothenoylcysteine decarboxylase/phosphopantothenate--cysteine ligase CoaBC [Chelatococcus sambhunathii]|uniref:Coenzyme A biosynthesis bifunctional protein CoaBC n=1 Tax=Chelatococcus sambhunathii TaxID=363953 RepID=A0ABU1DFH6_9HYPH|nr:bifunctional phosphopantothenoylcysteine decarboxylase/phosphopantothenate--cysteine ligase CoaBC [Chelatococcus sambhunathii]MDR4306856.1 bifunctional phosphopantothenoylcysteine decarboxylase/phosphopantothenate--cysteine ligase CoaBC [Chelatococcus sambhunathii]
MTAPRILLVIGGGIAAYKSLDLIRRLKERGFSVRAILTAGGAQFVTPLSVATLTAERCFQDLFDLTDEHDVGHIRLARDADLVLVAPATADLIAKMANGLANDLASTALIATTAPILLAPAMNPTMWENAATRRNVERLTADGVSFVGPETGPMAERGESGLGRMSEPLDIVAAVERKLHGRREGPLVGLRVLVTSGPTHEPIDPVRVLANRSSGRQGHAIAAAAARAGAEVTLVSGPVSITDPKDVTVVRVETAREMLEAVERSLPADIGVFAAAVADWRTDGAPQKLKKGGGGPPALSLVENPDILATVAGRADRPRLLVGFAAETENVVAHAKEKLARKGCDLIVANDVSPASGVMGGEANTVHLVSADGVESWPAMSKGAVAEELVERFAASLGRPA